MKLFFGNALWHLIEQSDFMTKAILLALVAVSVFCWALIFYKTTYFRTQDQQLRLMAKKIRTIKNKPELLQLARMEEGNAASFFVAEYIHELQTIVQKKGYLTAQDGELLDIKRYAVVDELVYQNESYLSVLSVAAASGPLVGLFGTVWGLTNSFISISEKQSADIVTIAPGMAEALMTTMAGLMVAIPMLVMFHYLTGRVRYSEHALHQISDQLHSTVQVMFVKAEVKYEGTIYQNETPKRSIAS